MYSRGTEWRKWDLHVHTPESLVHHYGKDPWDRFFTELSELPPEIAVIGVNDYWFLDGYRRVRAEFQSGRFPNLLEVFPVIEVRTENFGGVDGNLRRINLHFVCDPLLSPEVLERQLIARLQPVYRLRADEAEADWSQVVTRESLTELGAKIKAAAPEEKLSAYGSDLVEGFNNVCVHFEGAVQIVRQNTALADHVLLAVGKTEWAALKWNDQSIASKKTLLNSAQLVFTAAANREEFAASRNALLTANVNPRLVDCSDAHTWMDAKDKDRLGNTLTWINADPTFNGLQHAVQEYDHRVSVAPRPPVLSRPATRPTTVIERVAIKPVSSTITAPVFDCDVVLNPGFVVILGNKGQGKSALLDTTAAAANSDRHEDYSFLSTTKFRRKNGEAENYLSSVTWADGTTSKAPLVEPFTARKPIRIDYLPQSLIERVCLADPDSKQKRQFEAEIERVVFGHLSPEERGESTSLQQYLAEHSVDAYRALDQARAKIAEAVRDLVRLDERKATLAEFNLDGRLASASDAITNLDAEIAARDTELTTLHTNAGASDTQTLLEAAIREREELIEERRKQQRLIRSHGTKMKSVERLRTKLVGEIRTAETTAADLGRMIGVTATSLLKTNLDEAAIAGWSDRFRTEIGTASLSINEPLSGLDTRIQDAANRVQAVEETLRTRAHGSAALADKISDLKLQRTRLVGEAADSASLAGIQALIVERDALPAQITDTVGMLKKAFFEAHQAAMMLYGTQRGAYASATDFVASNELARNVGLEFEVELRARGFTAAWSDKVNKQRLGGLQDFLDKPERELLLEDVDLSSAEALFTSLFKIQDRLGRHRGNGDGDERPISTIVRTSYTAFDLLVALYDLSWLVGEYVIRSSGMELAELSPGQRGLVLLMFYLLVDKSDRPLLLDQPEENLDNQTVRKELIPALRAAIARRQVVVVTHNPNLAIVGDADQLIVATQVDGRFVYSSGSLAHLPIGTKSIDILEGTRAAFDNREAKYDRVVGKA